LGGVGLLERGEDGDMRFEVLQFWVNSEPKTENSERR
jgi:hypothetical protein